MSASTPGVDFIAASRWSAPSGCGRQHAKAFLEGRPRAGWQRLPLVGPSSCGQPNAKDFLEGRQRMVCSASRWSATSQIVIPHQERSLTPASIVSAQRSGSSRIGNGLPVQAHSALESNLVSRLISGLENALSITDQGTCRTRHRYRRRAAAVCESRLWHVVPATAGRACQDPVPGAAAGLCAKRVARGNA